MMFNLRPTELMYLILDCWCLFQHTEEKIGELKDAATDISRNISRRDMATQMSPNGSTHSSPKRQPFSSAPTALPSLELQSVHSSKSQVRDVQVDERVTVTRWSKKNRAQIPGKTSEIVDDWRKKSVDSQISAWDITESSKSISKYVSCSENFLVPLFY